MRSRATTPLAALCLLACQAPVHPLPEDITVEKLAGGMRFTEGPVWVPALDALIFSDIPSSKLMRWSRDESLTTFRECPRPNGNLLDLEGRLITCQHGARNIVRTEADGAQTVLADSYQGKRLNSPNDAAIQSDGTLWFTDPPWGLTRQREGKELDGHWVFRRDPSGTVTAVITNLAMPNGIALSPDERTLYVADTGGHPSHPDPAVRGRPAMLTAYAIGTDNALDPTPVWRIETRCDGMCLDVQGNIYATGKAVTVWRPDGTLLGTISIPEVPANVCFGEADWRTLFITARTSLYAVRLQVPGHRPRGARW